MPQRHRLTIHLDRPGDLVEATLPTVQMVCTMITGKLVLDAVDRKPARGNPVSVSANQRTEARVVLFVRGFRVKTENNVGISSLAVGRCQSLDNSTERQDFGRHTVAIFESMRHTAGPS